MTTETINKDYANISKNDVIEDLFFNSVNMMLKNNIQEDLVLHKTTLKTLEQLCANVVNNADKETLELFGSDVTMTYAGLGVRVFDMLRGVGANIEHPDENTVEKLNELEGKFVVDTLQ